MDDNLSFTNSAHREQGEQTQDGWGGLMEEKMRGGRGVRETMVDG